MFRSSHFPFLFLVYYIIFVYLLQGKMEKPLKENHTTKVTKVPKPNRQKYGMNET